MGYTHDPDDIHSVCRKFLRDLVSQLEPGYFAEAGITELKRIVKKHGRMGYTPVPNPNEPDQLCIEVELTKAPPKGVKIPQELRGKSGVYKVFLTTKGTNPRAARQTEVLSAS